MTAVHYGVLFTTIHNLGHQSSLEVAIDYTAHPEEPMVKYDRDGSGYPGCAASASLIEVEVLRWHVGDEKRLPDDSWIWDELTEIAIKLINEKWEATFEALCIEDANDTCDDGE